MATDNVLNKPSEMSFAEFAEAMKPSGAVNRFPAIGAGDDVYSYSVYMNGPMTAALPEHSLEHTFKDVMLHALTEKLQLNPASARDNLKVAEVVAVRSAWMSAVLERSSETALSAQVVNDYELLTKGLTHPWIADELSKQRALLSKLQPALVRAGIPKDVIPKETSIGKVVAQDLNFTFQKTNDGEVVTHENRRLNAMPALGSEVMVSYYRGTGQVVNSLETLKVSPPFIDPVSEDLAIMFDDGKGLEQVLLFNSMASFGKFVKAHGMDTKLVQQAMDAREASPKVVSPLPKRDLVTQPYVDAESGCIAVDYKENGIVYSALFRSATEMASLANEFDLGAKAVALGQLLESGVHGKLPESEIVNRARIKGESSELDLRMDLKQMGHQDVSYSADGASYVGKVVAQSALHVAQHIGRGAVVIHDLRTLDKAAGVGDLLTVKFDKDRGQVTDMVKAEKDLGR